MGLLSSVGKVFKSVAPALGTAVGTFFGGPVGGAAGGMLGSAIGGKSNQNADGSTDWLGMLGNMGSSALSAWTSNQQLKQFGDYNNLPSFDQQMAMQLAGIQAQNASAKELADKANQFSQANAREQMEFQRVMSAQAHQREVLDLKASGLNPILSGTGGMGAATGAGAQGSVTTAPVQNEGAAVSSAFDAFRSMAEAMKANAATTFMSGAQTALTTSQTENTQAQTSLAYSAEAVNKTRARLNQDQSLKIATEIQNLKALRENIPKTGQLTDAQTSQVQQTAKNLKQVFRDLKVKGDISEQDQAYWNGLLDQSGGSASGTLQLLNSLRQLLK